MIYEFFVNTLFRKSFIIFITKGCFYCNGTYDKKVTNNCFKKLDKVFLL